MQNDEEEPIPPTLPSGRSPPMETPRDTQAEIVKTLQDLLAQAENGEIVGLFTIAFETNNSFCVISEATKVNLFTLIGALDSAKHQHLRMCWKNEELKTS